MIHVCDTGINSIDIMLLESYTVYSHSKEKTASRFYIMKCSQPTTEGFIQVPIKDLIERFVINCMVLLLADDSCLISELHSCGKFSVDRKKKLPFCFIHSAGLIFPCLPKSQIILCLHTNNCLHF
jgi:hypothetical protein